MSHWTSTYHELKTVHLMLSMGDDAPTPLASLFYLTVVVVHTVSHGWIDCQIIDTRRVAFYNYTSFGYEAEESDDKCCQADCALSL